jgi:hypothetical protein
MDRPAGKPQCGCGGSGAGILCLCWQPCLFAGVVAPWGRLASCRCVWCGVAGQCAGLGQLAAGVGGGCQLCQSCWYSCVPPRRPVASCPLSTWVAGVAHAGRPVCWFGRSNALHAALICWDAQHRRDGLASILLCWWEGSRWVCAWQQQRILQGRCAVTCYSLWRQVGRGVVAGSASVSVFVKVLARVQVHPVRVWQLCQLYQGRLTWYCPPQRAADPGFGESW